MNTEEEWFETKYKDKVGTFWINKQGQLQKRFGKRKPKLLEGSLANNGYLFVSVCEDGISKKKTIHSIMGEVFLKNTHNHRNIDHINRIKTDNRLENLRWLSQSYNMLNTDTIKGVGFCKEKQKWYCRKGYELIGLFFTKEEAIACKYGYLKALGIITKANENSTNSATTLEHSPICDCEF